MILNLKIYFITHQVAAAEGGDVLQSVQHLKVLQHAAHRAQARAAAVEGAQGAWDKVQS